MDQKLKKHTVKSYDKDLQSISNTIDDLLKLALHSIDLVESLIKNPGVNFIDRITKHDYKINSLDNLIENKVTAMLALRQPMAVDLRYIVSALKVSSNIERIGDKAKSVVNKIHHIGHEVIDDATKKSLLKMLEIAKIMVDDAVQAFNSNDLDKVYKVLETDDEIDKIYQDLFIELINHDKLNRREVKTMVNILFIAKSFERLADHAVNIAEITYYVVKGEIIE